MYVKMNGNIELDQLAKELPLLRGLSAPTRAQLLDSAMILRAGTGSILFEQGAPPTVQHIVLSGSAHLYGRSGGREVLVEVVSAPDLVIPAAVATGAAYLMQARVSEPSRFLSIPAGIWLAAARRDPALALELVGSLARQFRRMVRQVKNLKLRTSIERVGCYILALSARQGTPSLARLPYEKGLIASELGITRESFSRALSALQRHGITVRGDTILIDDAARLSAQCGPDALIDAADQPVVAINALVT